MTPSPGSHRTCARRASVVVCALAAVTLGACSTAPIPGGDATEPSAHALPTTAVAAADGTAGELTTTTVTTPDAATSEFAATTASLPEPTLPEPTLPEPTLPEPVPPPAPADAAPAPDSAPSLAAPDVAHRAAPAPTARAQAGPRITVTPTTGLNPAGQTITVSGSGFNPNANNRFGLYVVFGPKVGQFWLDSMAFLAAKWVHVGHTPGPGQAELDADGSFLVTLDVKASYLDGNNRPVDCVASGCHVMTMAAHGVADRSQDVTRAVSFSTGATTTTPPTGGSTSTTPPGATANTTGASGTGSTAAGPSSGGSGGSASGGGTSVASAQESAGIAGTTDGNRAPASLAATGGIDTTLPTVAVALLAIGSILLVLRRRRSSR